MNNIFQLLKVYSLNIFGINKAIHSGDKKEKVKLTAFSILMVFVILMLLFVSLIYSMLFSISLEQANAMRTLPAIMMAVTSVVTLFTTIYKTNGVLFGFKDYETVMALPMKTSAVVASRLLMLYGMNILFALVIMVPSAVVYCIKVQPSAAFYIIFIITLLLVPMIPIVIATFLGLIVSIIASRFRRSNIVNLILTLLLISGIMVISFNAETVFTDFANISAVIMQSVNQMYPLTLLYTQAVCDYSISSLLLFCGLSIVPFAVFVMVVGRYFKRINTALTARYTASGYKVTRLKESSPFTALYQKELRRYFSSTLYVTNTAIGIVLLTIACVALVFVGAQKLQVILEIPELASMLNTTAPLMICFFVALSCTTASSISLEGKNLWIIKSLPVDASVIFMSKVAVNLTILVPGVIINGVLICFTLHTTALQTFFIFVTPLIYSFFISLLGIVINLFFPNFTWEAEVTVIKQSAAMLLAMLAGLVSVILPLVLVMNLSVPPMICIAGTSALFLLIDIALYLYLKNGGAKKFAFLS